MAVEVEIGHLVVQICRQRFPRSLALRLGDDERVMSGWRRSNCSDLDLRTSTVARRRPGVGRRARRTRNPPRRPRNREIQRTVAVEPRCRATERCRRTAGDRRPQRRGRDGNVWTGCHVGRPDSVHDMTPFPVFFGSYKVTQNLYAIHQYTSLFAVMLETRTTREKLKT